MEALRSLVARIRANPWLAVGIAIAALLVLAWLGWAGYVASDRGVNEGLGVLVAWPAIMLALALISLPFIGIYLLVKRLSPDSDDAATQEADEPAAEETDEEEETEEKEPEAEEEDDSEEADEEDAEEGDEEDDAEPEGDSDEESETEPETAAS